MVISLSFHQNTSQFRVLIIKNRELSLSYNYSIHIPGYNLHYKHMYTYTQFHESMPKTTTLSSHSRSHHEKYNSQKSSYIIHICENQKQHQRNSSFLKTHHLHNHISHSMSPLETIFSKGLDSKSGTSSGITNKLSLHKRLSPC